MLKHTNKDVGNGAPAPVYIFVLEKEKRKQNLTNPIKYKTN